MKSFKTWSIAAASLSLVSVAVPASADPVKNVVLVHGAWVDGSGWRPVHDILMREGFHVTIVQEPETSFADDVAATKRVLDVQDGPTLLVGHSYGGSIITEAGTHPNVVGLVYVAAHAPDVGEDESTLGKKMPSVLAQTDGAILKTPDGFTYLDPAHFPTLFAPDLPREQAHFKSRSQVLAAAKVFSTPLTVAAWKTRPSWGIVAGGDKIISPDLERLYVRARQELHDRDQRREPLRVRISPQGRGGCDRRGRAEHERAAKTTPAVTRVCLGKSATSCTRSSRDSLRSYLSVPISCNRRFGKEHIMKPRKQPARLTRDRAQPVLHQRARETQDFNAVTADLPLGLRVEVRREMARQLNQILADTMTLRDLYKKSHWQVSGPTFYQLHLLYDKHYKEQDELVDAIAERIQTLGGISIAMAHDVAETTNIAHPPRGREEVPVQLSRLMEAHEIIIKETRSSARRANQLEDDGTNDLLVSEVLRTNELQVWFLSEHLVEMPLVFAK